DSWEKEWLGTVKVDAASQGTPKFGPIRAFSPYILVVLLLVITRTIEPVTKMLTGEAATISFPNLLGTSISSSAQFLYSPGFILILASLACIGIFKMSLRQYGTAISDSVKTMIQAAPALLLAVPMVQVFI